MRTWAHISNPARIAAATCLFLLAACTDPAPVVSDPLDCFPKEARKWVFVDKGETAAEKSARPGTKATVYVDRSGSMVGYLKGATSGERPLQDLIGNLPVMLDRQGARTDYKAFGTNLTQILTEPQRRQLANTGYYSCPRGTRDCDNRESRLDVVFNEIETKPDEMALVITDLWFSNSDIQTSALSALASPLAHILAKGRAVAVYGIVAPFEGNIYDMPDSDDPIPFDGKHPLFVIAVGTDAQLADLQEAWLSAPSPFLAEELAAHRTKRSIFTLRPARAPIASPAPLSGGTDTRLQETTVIDTIENVRIQQFLVGRSAGLKEAAQGTVPWTWTAPTPSAFVEDSVWEGEFKASARVWDRRGERCEEGDWIQATDLPGLAGQKDGKHTFRLDPEIIASEIPQEGTYLLVGELARTNLKRPNPASDWMRQWGFGARSGNPRGVTADGSPFFATLHLGEVARLMESSLSDAAKTDKDSVLGFATVVRLED